MSDAIGFPLQQFRTRRFSLGAPRNFTVSPNGERVAFLRSPAGDNPETSLWSLATATGEEAEVANPAQLLGSGGGAGAPLPAAERARRERSRELAGGIVAYACDEAVAHAAFALGGRLWWADLVAGTCSELPAPWGAFDPHPSPDGRWVAFLAGPRLCAVETTAAAPWLVLAEEGGGPEEVEAVTWGAAEFVAAEEMGRARGFWWAPEGTSVLAARVDESPVARWWTADPANPASSPEPHRYPAAGQADAAVSLWQVGLAGGRRQVAWDADRYPYLAAVHWGAYGPPLLLVERRDHKGCAVLAVDLEDGTTSEVERASEATWVAWPQGVPAWLEGGKLLWSVADAGTWRLSVGGELVSPPGLQVREVTSSGRAVVFSASAEGEPEVVEAWEWSSSAGLRQLTEVGGVSAAYGDGPVKLVVSRSMRWQGTRARALLSPEAPANQEVFLADSEKNPSARGSRRAASVGSFVEEPVVRPAPVFLKLGKRELSAAVLLPQGHEGGKLPVLMAPYGGPGHQLVTRARSAWLEAQWFADQGFAVVVGDGRGTPGRGPGFEREIYLDLAGPALEDQVESLHAAADVVPSLDLSRVGIRGWSFGGYLAALAVLKRPDTFHAAVAGAPVTDWRLYDTYYTERYLGHPAKEPGAYERSSLIAIAAGLSRPLMVVHGLADDNVYAAHSLLLCEALLAAGRPFRFVPLPGVSHVAGKAELSANLLLAEVGFLQEALRTEAPGPPPEA
jgi:dipeptidyl-peptidase-4